MHVPKISVSAETDNLIKLYSRRDSKNNEVSNSCSLAGQYSSCTTVFGVRSLEWIRNENKNL